MDSSSDDGDTGLTANQGRLLYLIHLHIKEGRRKRQQGSMATKTVKCILTSEFNPTKGSLLKSTAEEFG